jgi:sulfur-carrier protein adenylyltransferase/sulfurtransferase
VPAEPVAHPVRTAVPLPPLVEPGGPLTPGAHRRYARHLILDGFGDEAQRRLAAARVLVVGAGGLGSPVLLYLAAAGVGTLGIADADTVDETNLQRQILHGQADLGREKVDSARDRVLAQNPDVRVRPHPVRVHRGNALDLLDGYHLVVDASDNFTTRYLLGDACEMLRLPHLWGAVQGFDGQVSVFWSGHGPVYRDLFPSPPHPGAAPSCGEAGILGVTCAAVGSVMATEAVKLLCGLGDPLVGRLLVFDGLAMSWRTVRARPDPDRTPVTSLDDGADGASEMLGADGASEMRGADGASEMQGADGASEMHGGPGRSGTPEDHPETEPPPANWGA